MTSSVSVMMRPVLSLCLLLAVSRCCVAFMSPSSLSLTTGKVAKTSSSVCSIGETAAGCSTTSSSHLMALDHQCSLEVKSWQRPYGIAAYSLSTRNSNTLYINYAQSRERCSGAASLHAESRGGAGEVIGGELKSDVGRGGMERNPMFEAIIQQSLTVRADGGNFTSAVEGFLDLCDNAFLIYLQRQMQMEAADSERGQALRALSGEINAGMQRRLVKADNNLRSILQCAPEIKTMEAKLKQLFRTGEVDMAFMVMLNMNLAQARDAGLPADNAVKILTHLNTKVMEYQDERVPPAVRVMRLLIRTDDQNTRKNILLEHLLLPFMENDPYKHMNGSLWGKGDIRPEDLESAIHDLAEQAQQLNDADAAEMTEKLERLRGEFAVFLETFKTRPGPFQSSAVSAQFDLFKGR